MSGTRKLMLKPILLSISQCLGHLQGHRVIKENPLGRRKMRKSRADGMLALFIMNQLYKVSYEVKLEDGTVIVKSDVVEFIVEDGFLFSHVWEEAKQRVDMVACLIQCWCLDQFCSQL